MQDTTQYAKALIGTVTAVQRWSDTHMDVRGRTNRPIITTDVEQRQEIFVKDDQGNESTWEIDPNKVSFRQSSRILIVHGKEGANYPHSIHYIANTDTGAEISPPTPMPNVPGVAGLVSGVLLAAVISISLYSFNEPLAELMTAKREIPASISTEHLRYAKQCPAGTTYPATYKLIYNKYETYTCDLLPNWRPLTSRSNPKLCECPSEGTLELWQKDRNNNYVQSSLREDSRRLASGLASFAWLPATLAGLILWFISNWRIRKSVRKIATATRESYAKAIESAAAEQGVSLKVTDMANLIVRRVR